MEGEGDARSWLGGWMLSGGDDGPVSNYYEDQKLMEGPLIKIGDYAHFRYFLLFRNGRFCYYELPMPKGDAGDGATQHRRVHVTLTPQHLRGVIMLNVSLIGKELAERSDDEYDSAAIQRGMAFNRKKLEMNLTGYSLTGQLTSWRLRAANDATYVKWEKAFRLALRPIWMQNTPHCLVCRQEFSLLFRQHHCRKCGTCMCDECSVFVNRLPMQGYYDVVRICRDCSPARIQQSELKVGTRVLLFGIYPGKIVQLHATDDSDHSGAFVSAELERQRDGRVEIRRVSLSFVELYSETILSANRIKNAIRGHLAQTLYRAQLNFSTWNLLETVQEQKTVQMVRILNKSSSISELTSMVPTLGSYDTPSFTNTDDLDEQELVRKSLEHYRGVHLNFPLRLETVMKLIDQFRNGILLHRVYVYQILEESHKMLEATCMSPRNLIHLPAGVNLIVVGDLHGQLEDLLTILEKNGVPSPKTWFLFNGDFVDRGSHGVEVIILLLSFKLLYPDFVFFNRGNHEERMINENFGFEDEIYVKYSNESVQFDGADAISCSRKYSCVQLFQMFEDVFTLLPIFSLINERVFVTHGGLSNHENVTIEELEQINHRRDVPTMGTSREDELFAHLLWSDPREKEGWRPSERGAGVEFGPDITKAFCALNHLSLVIRSHECQEQGYEITHDGMLLTIFSASSYCGSQTNKGAFVQLQVVENGNLKPHVVQYYSQPLQKLHDAGKNEWRKKALRLERRTMMSLAELLGEKKSALGAAFTQIDTQGTGTVTKLQWKTVLQTVLGIDVRFLSYFKQLVGAEASTADGNVDYESFLGRYTVELTTGSVEWRRHLVRRVWLAFCAALAADKGADEADAMGLDEKIVAAFDLFKESQQPKSSSSSNGDSDPRSIDLTKQYSVYIKSVRGIASQRSHQNFFKHGFITYDVFRSTMQGKLGLGTTLSEQQILELMQHMDENRDGFVDFDEFRSFFAEFSRSDYLQELFDLDDVRAVDLLQQFGSRLTSSKQFASLSDAFATFDVGSKGFMNADDFLQASQTLHVVPALDDAGARALHGAVLCTYFGVGGEQDAVKKMKIKKRLVQWPVFEDVFSVNSTRQRNLWMSSRNASQFNLDESSVPASPTTNTQYLSWADALLDTVKNALNEQRLYLKFVFRILDKKHRGYVSRSKFIAAMKCINQEHDTPLQDEQIEKLADAFTIKRPVTITESAQADSETASDVDTPRDSEVASTEDVVEYPAFLKSLRVVDAETHAPSRRRLHSASTLDPSRQMLNEEEGPFFV